MLIVLAREPNPVRGSLLQSRDHDVRRDRRHIWWTSRRRYSVHDKSMAMVPRDKVLSMVRNRYRRQRNTLSDLLGHSHSRRSSQLSPQFSSPGLSQPRHLQSKAQTPHNRISLVSLVSKGSARELSSRSVRPQLWWDALYLSKLVPAPATKSRLQYFRPVPANGGPSLQ
jgi:hypothetical protein